ncbi:MAG: NUDIX hydrolase [Candidatus Cloacimonetes bacterium]|nr:NUDIX hydrolase [Candidatus Cloacimonadota bacterium]
MRKVDAIMEYYNRDARYCIRCGSQMESRPDREGKLRATCTGCGWIFYRNPIPAAACVIFDEQGRLLLIKRRCEPKPGEWALPSGYIEIDQTPEETAVAEMREETGLVGEVDRFLGYFVGHSPLYQSILSFGYLMRVTGGKLEAGDDAAEARYVAPSEAPPVAFASHRRYIALAHGLAR